jgi:PAS domain-containing protein
MAGKRYRFILVDEPDTLLPIPYRPKRQNVSFVTRRVPDPFYTLLDAFESVAKRGVGPQSWARHLDNPVAFLLDAMGEAVVLRDHAGRMLYRNPAAGRIEELIPRETATPLPRLERIEGRAGQYERRCMEFETPDRKHRFFVEIIRKLD